MIAIALAASMYWVAQHDTVKYESDDFTIRVGEIVDARCSGNTHCTKEPRIEIQMPSQFPGHAHNVYQRQRDHYDGIGKMGSLYTVTYRNGTMFIQSADVAWFYLQEGKTPFRNPDDQEVWLIQMNGFKQAYNQMMRNR